MTYSEELLVLNQLAPRVKRALQRMAFDIKNGTTDQQMLYDVYFLIKLNLQQMKQHY